jgi:hypothetical protein
LDRQRPEREEGIPSEGPQGLPWTHVAHVTGPHSQAKEAGDELDSSKTFKLCQTWRPKSQRQEAESVSLHSPNAKICWTLKIPLGPRWARSLWNGSPGLVEHPPSCATLGDQPQLQSPRLGGVWHPRWLFGRSTDCTPTRELSLQNPLACHSPAGLNWVWTIPRDSETMAQWLFNFCRYCICDDKRLYHLEFHAQVFVSEITHRITLKYSREKYPTSGYGWYLRK